MKHNDYVRSIKKIFKAYLVLMFNFNLGTINIIPDWLADIMFYRSLDGVSQYEESAKLLKPVITIVGAYDFMLWFLKIFDTSFDIYVIQVIVGALSLYFHFQLITNLADICESHGFLQSKRLKIFRSLKTVILTVYLLPIDWSSYDILNIGLIVVSLTIQIGLCLLLYGYADDEKYNHGNEKI